MKVIANIIEHIQSEMIEGYPKDNKQKSFQIHYPIIGPGDQSTEYRREKAGGNEMKPDSPEPDTYCTSVVSRAGFDSNSQPHRFSSLSVQLSRKSFDSLKFLSFPDDQVIEISKFLSSQFCVSNQ